MIGLIRFWKRLLAEGFNIVRSSKPEVSPEGKLDGIKYIENAQEQIKHH